MNYDIIIIGGGIAGLTAAIYARRANKTTLVLESQAFGGQILQTENIENYPAEPGISGSDLIDKIKAQAKDLGANFKYAEAGSIIKKDDSFSIHTDDGDLETKAVIIATGTGYRKLNLSNEKDFLGKGLSYCTTCDGALYKDQEVAIYGGGNSALYSALYLSNLASKVSVIYRRKDIVRADAALISKVEACKNVDFILGTEITGLNGADKLESLTLTNVDDELQPIPDTSYSLPISALFVEIGREANNSIVKDLVDLDDKGYIIADESCSTKTQNLFAAGDCRAKSLRQLITASSDGAIAATSAVKALNTK